ncbi:nickel pincer cofactor biosynthesis protein LarB [Bengtsoniella intestinalis]|uniref:nickel pincer cofactor biosynthesis protein LarB n=1 Tax=Bengtsoniella intestinalis TaxID=3073143 RepID=UPI00391F9B7D
MDIKALLAQVKSGELDMDTAEQQLKNLPYEDLGYAKIDHHRKLRSGFPEVIFCSGKSMEHLVGIYKSFYDRDDDVLGTRASQAQYEAVAQVVPCVEYDPLSKVLKIHRHPLEQVGLISVCTGGTSDIAVAEEVAQVAEYFGSKVNRVYDVGVAGIHRLFAKLDAIEAANCIVAIAGMEGALAGVLAGLVSKPVIAVPTSIGYGASFGGLSALLTMLNSCAEGVSVVNIDNGFGAGYIATQINKLASK